MVGVLDFGIKGFVVIGIDCVWFYFFGGLGDVIEFCF